MVLIQLKNKDLKWVRAKLLEEQDYICAICGCNLKDDIKNNPKNLHVDHQHFGDKLIRGILCRRCNTIEGKLWNFYNRYTKKELKSKEDYMSMIRGLNFYYDNHLTEFIHPSAIKKIKKKAKKVKNNKKLKKVLINKKKAL